MGFLIKSLEENTSISAAVDSSNTKFKNNFSSLIKEKLAEGKIVIVADINKAMKEFNGKIIKLDLIIIKFGKI